MAAKSRQCTAEKGSPEPFYCTTALRAPVIAATKHTRRNAECSPEPAKPAQYWTLLKTCRRWEGKPREKR
ncbi:hypothetical protein BLNAU_17096 [Blattamonas nauphoetae]|uniref:Uncharacterized protein n=1 Tax=Blattamonas nauphoetae TaxID=2049346 RepID=A0ABQ9X9Q3_9EUKA|nr:hypothetical protein BLNAU_17096 [Blattamonas nauphoetae]